MLEVSKRNYKINLFKELYAIKIDKNNKYLMY